MPADTTTRSSHTTEENTIATELVTPRNAATEPTSSALKATGRNARRQAIQIGVLFLAATLTFMVGDRLITSAFASPTDAATLTVGVGFIAACGIAVAGIGVALFVVLRRFHRGLALGQMVFRILEWATIWGVGGYMLATQQPARYEIATYAFTGTAGLIATYALGRSGLIPGWLARLGIVGYVAIALTVPAELFDIVSLDSPAGMVLYLPGGVFELILPVLLIARGFRPVATGGVGRPASVESAKVGRPDDGRRPLPDAGARGNIGWIVAGSLLTGLVAGLALVTAPFVPAAEDQVLGALLCGFAVGWTVLAALSVRISDQPQLWATPPAVFMGLGGLALLAFGSPADRVLRWVWPPVLLVLVVWMAVRVRRELRSRSRWLLYPVFVVVLFASVGGAYQTVGAATDGGVAPMSGQLIDVGGHRLYLRCSGSGSPTVVLEPGGGEMSAALGWIEPAVARNTRVCVYDRAGRGRSEPADAPQDATRIATDLHALLERGGVPGPYVLAGHSFGGLYVLTFASRYPDDVAGMVLIDSTAPAPASAPTSPGNGGSALMDRVSALLSSSARLGVGRLLSVTDYGSLPPRSRDDARASGAMPSHVRSTIDEYVQASRSSVEAAGLSDLVGKPLAVLTAGSGSSATWMADQEHLATLSSNRMHRVVDGAVHASLLHDEHDAAATTQAILDVVASIRAGEPLGR